MINELDSELFDKIENCINGRQDFRIGENCAAAYIAPRVEE